MKKISNFHRVLLLAASVLMIGVYFVPFWQILMWAPQYPEWLSMQIWLAKITGDVEIINGLNHYIGMKEIDASMFPEFAVMPWILGGLIGFGVLAATIGRRYMVWIFLLLLVSAGTAGLVDFYLWGYDYGHNLDPHAAIKVPGMAYQPPLIGTKELLNFIAYSAPDWGGWLLATSGLMVILVVVREYFFSKKVLIK
jgi:copper chaperone NosL